MTTKSVSASVGGTVGKFSSQISRFAKPLAVLGSLAAGWFVGPVAFQPLFDIVGQHGKTDTFDIDTAFGKGRSGVEITAAIVIMAVTGAVLSIFGTGGWIGPIAAGFMGASAVRILISGMGIKTGGTVATG